MRASLAKLPLLAATNKVSYLAHKNNLIKKLFTPFCAHSYNFNNVCQYLYQPLNLKKMHLEPIKEELTLECMHIAVIRRPAYPFFAHCFPFSKTSKIISLGFYNPITYLF